jgi:hypothetical protein
MQFTLGIAKQSCVVFPYTSGNEKSWKIIYWWLVQFNEPFKANWP